MKKIYITLAVLSLAAIINTACDNREEEIGGDTELSSDVIAFSLKGISTRAEVSSIGTSDEVNIIPLGTDDQNNNFFLEESVIDLEAPVTRGTPVYTSNAMKVHGNAIATYAPDIQDDVFNVEYDETKNVFMKAFGREIWPAGTEQNPSSLEFYMNWPVNPTGVNISSRTGGKITFTYESPATAANQQDILFTYRNISKADYDNNGGKADILFHHALTGVKFATKNTPEDAVTIKEVRFTGLIDKGTCTVTPTTEDGKYVDDPDIYSSADAVVWSNTSKTGNTIKSGAYPLTDDGKNILVNFTGSSFDTKGAFPESFAKAGNTNNLNDGDATQTFWLIPQAMTDDVKLTIEYTVKGASETTEGTWTINFGEVLAAKNVEWEAGQIRTYTIKVDDVNVKIADDVTIAGNENNGFTGSSKTNVVITNTGNTDAFIRAAIIGQWLDSEGNPVFGFTDPVNNEVVTVESWYEDQFVKTTAGTHGTFVGLAGYKGGANPLNKWHLSDDGFYYYEDPVPAGDPVPNNLFTSYTVGTMPEVTISDVPVQVYFVMEIATQAISAKKLDGTYYATYTEAWANANATE